MACTLARLSLNDSHLTIIFLLYNFSHNWAGDQEGGNEHVRENPRSPMLMSSKLLDQTNANCGCSMFMCDHWKCSVDVSRSNRVEKNVALCKWAVMQWETTNRSEDTGAHLISCEMMRYSVRLHAVLDRPISIWLAWSSACQLEMLMVLTPRHYDICH